MIGCVIRTFKSKKNRTVDYFKLTTEQVELNKTHFKKVHKSIKKNKEVSSDELFLYERIIFVTKIQDLHDWNSQVLLEIDQESRQMMESG